MRNFAVSRSLPRWPGNSSRKFVWSGHRRKIDDRVKNFRRVAQRNFVSPCHDSIPAHKRTLAWWQWFDYCGSALERWKISYTFPQNSLGSYSWYDNFVVSVVPKIIAFFIHTDLLKWLHDRRVASWKPPKTTGRNKPKKPLEFDKKKEKEGFTRWVR